MKQKLHNVGISSKSKPVFCSRDFYAAKLSMIKGNYSLQLNDLVCYCPRQAVLPGATTWDTSQALHAKYFN